MNYTINEKLDRIYELYTPERLQKSKNRFLQIDAGKKPADRYPFCLEFPYFNPYNINHPPKERLEAYLDAFLFLYQFDDDTIPYVFPGLDHASIPSMFGASKRVSGIETTSEKIIHSPEDVYKLKTPVISDESAAHQWMTMAEYILEETKGRIPVNVCDMQGPFDACAQMWSYDEMFLAAYENPEIYHYAISRFNEAFILLWNTQKEFLGDLFLGTHLFSQGWVPPDCGTAVSADSLVMISPDFYHEFYEPHLVRLKDEYPRITIHSCGDFRHLIPALCQTDGICAINASQLSVREIHQAGLDPDIQLLLAVHYSNLSDEIRYTRDNGLNVRWVINGVMPWENGKLGNPEIWTKEDFDDIQRKIDQIHVIMKV
jgi:hypothetical protein